MPNSAPPKRCVIADDVRASRETVGKWLRESGFDCRLLENGQLAWEVIKDRSPDLLVTDLEMPELCGFELLEKIRESDDESIRDLPVLIMTSLQDVQTRSVVQQLGGDGLLQKPLDKHATLSVILDLVSAGRSLRERAHPDEDTCVKGRGVISPTLRRLLSTVAKKHP
ncbi:Response regulator MprA [Novipirellula aureliae]|uniref:Response regulator MprA n=1 Tax=Novipirellula aureliae TaxID=2527966 RepID=A0A5C6DQB8_9BACT|nr:response regulator [Novipirellula aureliae]TWU38812.1 Response regulator MprA [Novipirellula aureliae]